MMKTNVRAEHGDHNTVSFWYFRNVEKYNISLVKGE